MTRKDIIIIAVLANMGVLAILFMLAFRNDGDKSPEPEINYSIVEGEAPQKSDEPEIVVAKSDPTDEVDTVLEDLAPLSPSSTSTNDDYLIQLDDPSPTPQKADKRISSEPHSASDNNFVEVTIKRGDALEKIARANGTTVDAIKKANNLKTDRLKIGQVLQVPIGSKNKIPEVARNSNANASTSSSKQIASTEQYYTIKAGDNPWKIAKQFHIKVDDLLKLNSMDEDKARNLKVGDQIRVQ